MALMMMMICCHLPVSECTFAMIYPGYGYNVYRLQRSFRRTDMCNDTKVSYVLCRKRFEINVACRIGSFQFLSGGRHVSIWHSKLLSDRVFTRTSVDDFFE